MFNILLIRSKSYRHVSIPTNIFCPSMALWQSESLATPVIEVDAKIHDGSNATRKMQRSFHGKSSRRLLNDSYAVLYSLLISRSPEILGERKHSTIISIRHFFLIVYISYGTSKQFDASRLKSSWCECKIRHAKIFCGLQMAWIFRGNRYQVHGHSVYTRTDLSTFASELGQPMITLRPRGVNKVCFCCSWL